MEQSRPIQSTHGEIDRDSFEPAYNQLVNILRRKIAAGEYRPGDRLPSEAELCSHYQVSTITARRAIKILVDQDIAETRQGHGTYLKPLMLGNATFDLHGLEKIFTDPATRVRILGAAAVNANERVAAKLNIQQGTRVIHIRRALYQADQPIMFHREYMILDPTNPTVEAELEVTSLGRLFTGTGSSIFKRGDLAMDATVLDGEEAFVLKHTTGAAAFRIEHIFYDFSDCVVSWGWFICRGDKLRFKTSVGV